MFYLVQKIKTRNGIIIDVDYELKADDGSEILSTKDVGDLIGSLPGDKTLSVVTEFEEVNE